MESETEKTENRKWNWKNRKQKVELEKIIWKVKLEKQKMESET